nr:MAG TPA: hypothetical protein [Caudoviricetes sp.]
MNFLSYMVYWIVFRLKFIIGYNILIRLRKEI